MTKEKEIRRKDPKHKELDAGKSEKELLSKDDIKSSGKDKKRHHHKKHHKESRKLKDDKDFKKGMLETEHDSKIALKDDKMAKDEKQIDGVEKKQDDKKEKKKHAHKHHHKKHHKKHHKESKKLKDDKDFKKGMLETEHDSKIALKDDKMAKDEKQIDGVEKKQDDKVSKDDKIPKDDKKGKKKHEHKHRHKKHRKKKDKLLDSESLKTEDGDKKSIEGKESSSKIEDIDSKSNIKEEIDSKSKIEKETKKKSKDKDKKRKDVEDQQEKITDDEELEAPSDERKRSQQRRKTVSRDLSRLSSEKEQEDTEEQPDQRLPTSTVRRLHPEVQDTIEHVPLHEERDQHSPQRLSEEEEVQRPIIAESPMRRTSRQITHQQREFEGEPESPRIQEQQREDDQPESDDQEVKVESPSTKKKSIKKLKPKIITTIDEASGKKCICPCKCSCTDEQPVQEQAQDELPESTDEPLQRQDHKSKQNEKWIPEMEKYHEYDKRKENIPAFEIKEDIKSPDLIKGGDPEDMPGMKPNYETKHKNNAKKMHRKHSTRVRSFITLNVK